MLLGSKERRISASIQICRALHSLHLDLLLLCSQIEAPPHSLH